MPYLIYKTNLVNRDKLAFELDSLQKIVILATDYGYPKTMEKKMDKNETGRSTLEILSILAIAILLTLGAFAGYSKAVVRYKANQVIDQVLSLSDNIRRHYAEQTSYAELNNQALIEQKSLLPTDITIDTENQQIRNPFNGQITVAAGQIGYSVSGIKNDQKAFLIKYAGLPREACVTVATYDWNAGPSSGLIGLRVSGKPTEQDSANADELTDIIGSDGLEFQENGIACTGAQATAGSVTACVGGITGVPLPMAQANVACNCDSANDCAIVWTYY